jgi:type IV pilus assembly protein PilQ
MKNSIGKSAFSVIVAVTACFISIAAFCADETPAKTITLDIKDMEITDVLRMIADQSGINIVASKNVKGLITINLQDVPVDKALDAILQVNNCGYIKTDNIVQVYTYPELSQKDQFLELKTQVFRLEFVKALDLKASITSLISARGKIEIEPKTNSIIVTDTPANVHSIDEALKQMDKKIDTKVFRLNYAKPQDIQKQLLNVVPQAEGDMLIDERTNSIIVSAAPILLEKIDALIAAWDTMIPQVLIEAKILQITLEKNRLLGVDWQIQNPSKHSLTFGATNLPIPTGVPYVDAFKIGVLNVDDYEATIKALEQSNDANLISSPRIVTLDNKEAKILIGSSEPYDVFKYDENGTVTGKEIKFVEVGIKLVVTPKIAQDGFITLTIHPEVSSPRTGTASDALAVDTTEADTIMTIKDGNTVVLGGLIKDDKETNVSKIPILGDIPILKYLFRSTYTATTKKEIIIFITPKIIQPGAGSIRAPRIPDATNTREEEMQRALQTSL